MLPRKTPVLLALLALLAVLAYLPTMRQPLLEDDYPLVSMSQTLGAPAQWKELANSVFRSRATAVWLMKACYDAFGLHPAPYYCVTILLHILNTWLVYGMGAWRPVGYGVSAWAAVFFAIYEGHQEAVMWFAACNELLQFLFGMAAVLCWLHFLNGGPRRAWWYAGAMAALFLALISKESAPVFLGLLVISAERKRVAALAAPAALAAAWALSIYLTRDSSFRFQDGSFSLHAPFWRTLPVNFTRLFWFWGMLGLGVAWRRFRPVVWRGVLWAVIALLPYCFLTYSSRIPSRQLYLASAGVALIVGAGMLELEKRRRSAAAVVCTVMLVHNIGYLWTKKRAQFLQRAEPTEQLIALGKRTPGPIYVQCFPRPGLIAQEALHLAAGKAESEIIWDAAEANRRHGTPFCYK